ncbi:TNF receptor-associated factor 6-A [Strongylocentrotus purpuratus]|uniref:RING-type E3 ubiquitin transferase n=1 Tax=Strongylocentrotus purpuratus TaxID=7668 RepID=A0A7M7HFP1_STRPU|nr:TNF receptor-associated factor 6-A [Strongylocentrotus purpuratus]XP_011671903.2 TNF receptor-associated factor 6-A [Strongylocentrotus purpuratus]XP_789994.4 TNF receptor-associated factor 6-A [Strongylocentrotus purpuratus]
MSGQYPCNSDPGLDPRYVGRPQSPNVNELRGIQRGYSSPTGGRHDVQQPTGPPPIPEAYYRNFGHIPATIQGHVGMTFNPDGNQCQVTGPLPLLRSPNRGAESPLPSGYDYHFEPTLDPKYECPICLMCLRDPVQTECGHRFCSDCIKRCLRNAGLRCPVDNVSLTEAQMFPDVCVRREILDLQARCPYQDCPDLLELRDIESHKESCSYRTEPCPNQCGASMRRRSIDRHVEKECPRRLIECTYCRGPLCFNQKERHHAECPKRPISCEYCHKEVLSDHLHIHHQHDCTEIPVPCQFASFGCSERLPKERMAIHVSQSMEAHLQLMAIHFQNQQTQLPRTTSYPGTSWRMGATYDSQMSEFATAAGGKITDVHEHGARKLDPEQLVRTQIGPSNYVTSPSVMPSFGSGAFDPMDQFRALRITVKDLQEKEVWMRQKVIELESKAARKDSEIATLRNEVHSLQEETKDLREHVANGIFVWRLRKYSELRVSAERGEAMVRHSEGFYTGSCGYRLCVRVNINKSETRKVLYISLFVHFMQGKYDSSLEWPFRGSITLSLVDQNIDPELKQKNITERLVAKSNLDAFKKPKTARNHKGFGYMEFASIESLEKEGLFIKDNTILIKVEVHPQSN